MTRIEYRVHEWHGDEWRAVPTSIEGGICCATAASIIERYDYYGNHLACRVDDKVNPPSIKVELRARDDEHLGEPQSFIVYPHRAIVYIAKPEREGG